MDENTVDENFEERLSGMMNYRTVPVSAFIPADVVAAGARRRSRNRIVGVTAGALTVVAVGAGVAVLAGNHSASGAGLTVNVAAGGDGTAKAAVTPSGTAVIPSAPARAVSRVLDVKSDTPVEIVPGADMTVTATVKCVEYSGAFAGNDIGCKDVTSANMAYNGKPSLSVQGTGITGIEVLTGTYQGPAVPALIEVVAYGKHYTATIVETAGMKNWVGYYVSFPSQLQTVTKGSSPFFGFVVSAYDAAGHKLTQMP